MWNPYDFYNVWTQAEREASIINKDVIDNYYPIMFPCGWSNYGHDVGLLHLIKWDYRESKHKPTADKWEWAIRIAAFSPDDLDCSLDISKPDPYLFDELAKFMKNMTRFYSNYPNALMDIQTHFLCGEIR